MQYNSTSLLLFTIVPFSFQVHFSIPCNFDSNFASSLDKIHLFVLWCHSYILPNSNKVTFYCDFMRVFKGALFIFLQETYFTSLFLFGYLCNILPVLASRTFSGKLPSFITFTFAYSGMRILPSRTFKIRCSSRHCFICEYIITQE